MCILVQFIQCWGSNPWFHVCLAYQSSHILSPWGLREAKFLAETASSLGKSSLMVWNNDILRILTASLWSPFFCLLPMVAVLKYVLVLSSSFLGGCSYLLLIASAAGGSTFCFQVSTWAFSGICRQSRLCPSPLLLDSVQTSSGWQSSREEQGWEEVLELWGWLSDQNCQGLQVTNFTYQSWASKYSNTVKYPNTEKWYWLCSL